MPYKDFTAKAPLDSFESVEAKLIAIGAVFSGTDFQKDTYFETKKGKLKYREGTIEHLITHYQRIIENGMERSEVFRYETQPSQAAITKLYSEHKIIGTTEKQRKIYHFKHIKIHLDLLPDKRKFIEIEAIDREGKFSNKELSEQCLAMAELLQIPYESFIKTGYFQ